METIFKKPLIYSAVFLFTWLWLNHANAQISANSQATPTPHTQYQLLYTLNARKGVISLQPDHGNGYQLVLQDIHPKVTYQTHTSKVTSSTITVTQLLQLWQNAATQQQSITGDLTGVQIDSKTGHKQFYQVVKLSNPQYQAERNEITFNVIFTQPDKPANALEEMDNATLFINGCNLCACTANKVTCNY